MAPQHVVRLSGRSDQGWFPGQVKNRSMRPSPKDFFFRSEGYCNKLYAEIAVI